MSDDPMDIQNLAKAASEQLKGILSQDIIVQQQAHIKKLEAKLAEVVAVGVRVRDYFTHHSNDDVYAVHDFNEAIAYLKGQNDE